MSRPAGVPAEAVEVRALERRGWVWVAAGLPCVAEADGSDAASDTFADEATREAFVLLYALRVAEARPVRRGVR